MNSRFLLALVVALAHGALVIAQTTASIQGTVVDFATGKPVQGAIIVASIAATRTISPIGNQTATSSFDGGFQIPSLAAGTYNLCVQVPRDGYLNTCQWGIPPSTITVATGQNSTGNTVKLKAGSVLKIHLDDPGQLLNQKTKDGYSPDLMMGVWSAGMFYPAHVANKGSAGADYQVTVPLDATLNFSVQSRHLAIGDASKKPLPNNADAQAFQHASNAPTPAGYSYSILSAKP